MINYSEIREMTIGEFIEFVTKLSEGNYSQYDIPVEFHYERLNRKIRENVITNEWEFAKFLSYLYCVYRKIEIKMERAGYPYILSDSDVEDSLVNIRTNLNKIKRNCKFAEKNDFLKMYTMLKQLFIYYTAYIKYSIDHLINIDEGRYLPRTYDEIEPWLQKLNTWFPAKVNGRWINCLEPFIVIPSGYEAVATMLRATTKFSHYLMINSDEVAEPCIEEENKKRIPFGFVNMEGARIDRDSNNSVLLESLCPEECTKDIRRWICTKCGWYLKIKTYFDGFQYLFCCCGSKEYSNSLFICHHFNRQPQYIENKQVQEFSHPPVPIINHVQ